MLCYVLFLLSSWHLTCFKLSEGCKALSNLDSKVACGPTSKVATCVILPNKAIKCG